jgi:hypothetical protein
LRQDFLVIKQDIMPMEQNLMHVHILSSRAENARANPTSKIMKVPRKEGSLPAELFHKIMGEIGSMCGKDLTNIIKFYRKDVPLSIIERRRELCGILGAPHYWLHELQRGGDHS